MSNDTFAPGDLVKLRGWAALEDPRIGVVVGAMEGGFLVLWDEKHLVSKTRKPVLLQREQLALIKKSKQTT